MILQALVAASLLVPVSIDRAMPDAAAALSMQQRRALVRPAVSSATECIARTVSADPRFPAVRQAGEVNDLIVESMPSCVDAVRSMIDAYDRAFGEGTGETFFMGPYLDELPAAVNRLMTGAP